MSQEHIARHKKLDDHLNELVGDFIDHSGVPAHTATVHDLLTWSRKQRQATDHPNDHAQYKT